MFRFNCLIFIIFPVLASCSDSAARNAPVSDAVTNDEEVEYQGMESDFYRQCTGAGCQFEVTEGSELDLNATTWHPHDTGIRIGGNPAVLSVNDDFSGHPDAYRVCYRVSVLGAWREDVHVSLRLTGDYGLYGVWGGENLSDSDLQNLPEGHFEVEHEVTAAPWEPWNVEVLALQERGRMTFSIEKTGDGDARFYYIEVSSEQYCGDDAIEVDG